MEDTVEVVDTVRTVYTVDDMLEMEDAVKHSIRCNMFQTYNEDPGNVDNIRDMLTQGIFYKRVRFNSFGHRWKNEVAVNDVKVRENHAIAAIGGSLIYRSGCLNGFSVGGGLYVSSAAGSLDESEAYLYKAGKGVFNRYDYGRNGSANLYSLAQAYLEYRHEKINIKVGRQVFESFLTKSNDTKMIPNTFEGLTINSSSMYDTSFNMAYLISQKLRDHSDFHHVLAAGDLDNDPYNLYSENDDAAMHFGLKKSELEARGIDDKLIVAEAKNRSIDNLTINMNYTAVPELVSSAMIQVDYRMDVGGWSVIPALRYMQQFDDGAGEIGGANLKTLTQGYSDPDSLDAALYAARVDVVQDAFKLRFAYTQISDEGDIVAPWRGFPTAGFTRAMSQYNWCANTESYMMQLDYKFDNVSDFKIISRFAIQDFDDEKIGVQADSNVFTIDFLKGLGETSYYLKTRFAHVVGDDDTITSNGFTKLDPSYNEVRIEINYLF
ncbi:MAG: hypothetical protein DRG09_02445 [Epsilonproteobacteria bacterium]|nr:MAG: hypothetical protein DRG09_02445 [Campylobacterota bacterium]